MSAKVYDRSTRCACNAVSLEQGERTSSAGIYKIQGTGAVGEQEENLDLMGQWKAFQGF